MFKVNYKALLKALSSLFIPTISICIFTFFLVLDLNKLLNIIFGPNWYSILIRLFILLLEIWLAYEMYVYYSKKDNMESIKNDTLKNIANLEQKYNFNFTCDKWGEINVPTYEINKFLKKIMISNDSTKVNNVSLLQTNNNTENTNYYLLKVDLENNVKI